MTNIILLVKDRPRLTEQTLRTLYENTPQNQFNLTIVDDGSKLETLEVLAGYGHPTNAQMIVVGKSIGIVGFLRNIGAAASERYFGRGDYLCFIDNDIAFLPGWLDKITKAKELITINGEKGFALLGGYRHPFHGVNQTFFLEGEYHGALNLRVEETDAVAGYMHFMSWATWDLYGPYDQHAKGVCQSEDWAFCRKIIEQRGHVGYVHPPVIANCGLTNSEGKPAIGHEAFWRVPGLIYE